MNDHETRTIYTTAGDTIVVTKQDDGQVNLLCFNSSRGFAVELELDDRAVSELKEVFGEFSR